MSLGPVYVLLGEVSVEVFKAGVAILLNMLMETHLVLREETFSLLC